MRYLTGNGNTEDGLYFYHGNHLSSTQLITDINANVVQQVLYAPFGEIITEYNAYWKLDTIPRFLFNAKDLDEESGMYYYEARYYAPPSFISRDPAFEMYPTLSPYNYCANNPLKYIDPTGMFIDDYFDIDGKYLGSDNAKTDNVRIIDRATWDANKTVNADGTESIHHQTGNAESVSLSESDISNDKQLFVYQHYNSTNLPLQAASADRDPGNLVGMSTVISSREKRALHIEIKLNGNKKHNISDHANEIINLFSHEDKHYSDLKTMGYDGYLSRSKDHREQRACRAQMEHKSYSKTRPVFQHWTQQYLKQHTLPIIPSKSFF
jgi:RHS repeat-associated protein